MIAREDGLSVYESGFYSFLMSTFFWEYGYEAFAERPSIQDIIFTPLLGSFLGEEEYYWKKELDKKDGILFGSRKAGDIAYFVLNPIGEVTHYLKKEVGVKTKVDFYYSVYEGSEIGFKFNIYF